MINYESQYSEIEKRPPFSQEELDFIGHSSKFRVTENTSGVIEVTFNEGSFDEKLREFKQFFQRFVVLQWARTKDVSAPSDMFNGIHLLSVGEESSTKGAYCELEMRGLLQDNAVVGIKHSLLPNGPHELILPKFSDKKSLSQQITQISSLWERMRNRYMECIHLEPAPRIYDLINTAFALEAPQRGAVAALTIRNNERPNNPVAFVSTRPEGGIPVEIILPGPFNYLLITEQVGVSEEYTIKEIPEDANILQLPSRYKDYTFNLLEVSKTLNLQTTLY